MKRQNQCLQAPESSHMYSIFFLLPRLFCQKKKNVVSRRATLYLGTVNGSGKGTGGPPGLQIRCTGLTAWWVGSIPMHFRQKTTGINRFKKSLPTCLSLRPCAFALQAFILFFQQRISHFFPLDHELFRNLSGDIPDPADIPGPFRHADGLPGIQQVEGVRTL